MTTVCFIGECHVDTYERSVGMALEPKYTVIYLGWRMFFNNLMGRVEEKYNLFLLMSALYNLYLAYSLFRKNPEIIILWRATRVSPTLIAFYKRLKIVRVISYNHDDFSGAFDKNTYAPHHHRRLWSSFYKLCLLSDHVFVKRQKNIDDLLFKGVCHGNVSLMPMWYVKEIHKPIKTQIEYDFIFIGHFEDDGRDLILNQLYDRGYKICIVGARKYWSKSKLNPNLMPQIDHVSGINYSKMLNKSRFCLCFLSKINNDVITRRCFEIPACGCVLVSEYSDYLNELFVDESNIILFKNVEDITYKTSMVDLEQFRHNSFEHLKALKVSNYDIAIRFEEKF